MNYYTEVFAAYNISEYTRTGYAYLAKSNAVALRNYSCQAPSLPAEAIARRQPARF